MFVVLGGCTRTWSGHCLNYLISNRRFVMRNKNKGKGGKYDQV